MVRRLLSGSAGLVLSASAMTTLGTLPVFLLSAQSVFVRADLDFDEQRFGLVVSVFFAAAAITALGAGGLMDRLGQRVGTIVAGMVVAGGGFGLAVLTRSWTLLLIAMALLGIGNAACQLISNLTMAQALPAGRRGLGFGVKQAAIPLAIAISGASVPVVAETVGWRWSFVLTGAGGLLLVVRGLRLPGARARVSATRPGQDRPPLAPLVTSMVAVTLASAAANSFGAFLPAWGFEAGMSPSEAGALMAVGSAANIAVRVVSGHLADRRHGRNLPVVAAQMAVGAVALLVISLGQPQAVAFGGLVVFVLGWSWPGLLLYAVVRVGRDTPARASGFVQAGAFAGGAAGPALFGTAVGFLGYESAWRLTALVFVAAAGLILLARRMFIVDLVARPPTTPLRYGRGRVAGASTTPPIGTTSRADGCGTH